MTLVDFGDFKLRFDNKEVRISIDGDIIDVGSRVFSSEEEEKISARMDLEEEEEPLPQINEDSDRVFPLLGGDYLIKGKRVKREDKIPYRIYHEKTGEVISLDELMKRLGHL